MTYTTWLDIDLLLFNRICFLNELRLPDSEFRQRLEELLWLKEQAKGFNLISYSNTTSTGE